MILVFLRRLGIMACLLLVQGLILNQVNIEGYATPIIYIYFLLTFRKDTSRNVLLLWGFFLGLLADLFTNSPGVSAGSCTFLALCQPLLLKIFVPRDCAEDLLPSFQSMGVGAMIRYLISGTLLFQLVYYLLDAFSLVHSEDIFINIVGGTFTSLLLMIAIAFASYRK